MGSAGTPILLLLLLFVTFVTCNFCNLPKPVFLTNGQTTCTNQHFATLTQPTI